MEKIIVSAKRTPIGRFLGSFYECNPMDVCVQLMAAVLSGTDKKDYSIGIFGNVLDAGLGQGFSRALCLNSGLPEEMPSYTLNMVCGSGSRSIINACEEIDLGSNVVICGGYEFMSNVPYATNTYLRLGKKFGNFEMVDLLIKDGLTDYIDGTHMGITAENIAESLGITREEQDRYAMLAQQRAIAAVDGGVFRDEIVPISLFDYKKRPFLCEKDEFPNRDSTLEKLSALRPAFKSNGTVTAGNTSGINDGACFLSVASREYAVSHHLDGLAEIVDYASVGCDHSQMGLGPFFAIKKLLSQQHLSFSDISLFEINEAFAAQILGDFKLLAKEYGVREEEIISITNLHGSGIGLGHPLGCTGARIVTTLAHSMKRKNMKGKYGIASLCVGGGQGVAILLKGV